MYFPNNSVSQSFAKDFSKACSNRCSMSNKEMVNEWWGSGKKQLWLQYTILPFSLTFRRILTQYEVFRFQMLFTSIYTRRIISHEFHTSYRQNALPLIGLIVKAILKGTAWFTGRWWFLETTALAVKDLSVKRSVRIWYRGLPKEKRTVFKEHLIRNRLRYLAVSTTLGVGSAVSVSASELGRLFLSRFISIHIQRLLQSLGVDVIWSPLKNKWMIY
jgi:hypothetical protein